jgi:hypothetical protein
MLPTTPCCTASCRFTLRVLVPCFAEPLSVVSATVTAAMEAALPPGVRHHAADDYGGSSSLTQPSADCAGHVLPCVQASLA